MAHESWHPIKEISEMQAVFSNLFLQLNLYMYVILDELTELSDTIPYYSDISSYIGILRLQVEFCPLNLLEQIEHNNLVKFAIGDEIKEEGQIEKSKNKVHLDSISLIQD
jgi:hypothetical protein